MKKKISLLLAMTLPTVIFAQTVQLKESVATQLIFPSNIEHHRGGFNPDDFVKPQVYSNILYIQPLTSFEASTLSVITVDGCHYSIKIEYNPNSFEDYFVFAKDMSIYNSKQLPATSLSNIDPSTFSVQKNTSIDPVVSKILDSKGFISTRNAVKYKSSLLSIIGVYSCDNKIYIRLSVSNASQIPYVIEHIGFTLTVKPTAKLTSNINEILIPMASYYTTKTIQPKLENDIVFGFDKFTIGAENMLLIDLVESGGARNITLKVTDELLLTAKQI